MITYMTPLAVHACTYDHQSLQETAELGWTITIILNQTFIDEGMKQRSKLFLSKFWLAAGKLPMIGLHC
jgi:hypothetical protein